MLTNQIAFDTVAKHLFTQGEKSTTLLASGAIGCAYRGENNTKCAIGALIPDSLYEAVFDGENKTITSLLAEHPAIRQYFEGVSSQLLADLQWCHDSDSSWFSTGVMRERLREHASIYGIDTSILETLSFKGR